MYKRQNQGIFTNFNLTNMIQFHREKKAIATIAVSEVEDFKQESEVC
jgi:NDP-sugar pyrophosphorylase family protein